jgi:site-specific DNA recombinase
MKAIIVARVSTEEQKEAGNSLPAQTARMQAYCERNDFIIVESFSFAESAYKTKRDEFDKIIAYVDVAKEKIAICFDKVDRLSRNIFDKRVALLYEKAVNGLIELHFVSDSQIVNSTLSAGDKFAFSMKLGLSKYYSDAISDHVKRANEKKRRDGIWTGKVRIGYKNITDENGKKDVIADPERKHIITRMFEVYATGNQSYESIRLIVADMGLRSLNGKFLSKSSIENILKDPFYCGTAVSKVYGSYTHKYPRLITRELFDKCQQVREG